MATATLTDTSATGANRRAAAGAHAVYPSLEQARELAKRGNLIPVYRELLADMETPVSVYRKIARGRYSFLLESVEGGERLARYSFIGTEPELTVTLHRGVATIERHSTDGPATDRGAARGAIDSAGVSAASLNGAAGPTQQAFRDPLDFIRQLLAPYRPVPLPDMPRFQGGAVGYLTYECVRYFEDLPSPERDDLGLADAVLMLADTLVVFDHVKHRMRVISHADLVGGGSLEEAYGSAVRRVNEVTDRLRGSSDRQGDAALPLDPLAESRRASLAGSLGPSRSPGSGSIAALAQGPGVPAIESTFSREMYEAAVGHAKEYVSDGDIIQVVPSQRLSRAVGASPFTIYRALRAVNPSPYMYFLELDDIHIVGASPEMLVQVEDGVVRTRPIAGTRPRGKTEQEDKALAADLLADEKERAEHIMLVDLGRNDVGRVTAPGSVKVTTLMDVERYSHVMHIVSQVEGRLRDD